MKIKKYLLSAEVASFKPMNAANNGPNGPTFKAYKALRVPYGRTHDTPLGEVWSSHVVDINQIFPDWNANVNNPKSYDFTLTDELLQDMINAGTEPFFRLGQSIEHEHKKYGIYPPKDTKDVIVALPQGYKVASIRLTDSQKELDRKIEPACGPLTLTLDPNAVALIEFIAL